MLCVDGMWVVMRAGVQASGAILVWVGRVVYSVCCAWGEGGGWDVLGSWCVVCVGGASRFRWGCILFKGRVRVFVVW